MKKILLGALALLSMNAFGQNVYIPDANFKNALLNLSINSNGDNEIQVSEAQAFDSYLALPYSNISDATGLEEFINITGVDFEHNNLTTLDVSNNPLITYVYLRNNQLTSINFGTNSIVNTVQIQNNNFQSLDLSELPRLRYLSAENNNLTSIDVSQNDSLYSLGLSENNISSIDVTNNTMLSDFWIDNNPISSIDLSNQNDLVGFGASHCNLSTLDVSNSPNLGEIYISHNSFTHLDFSMNNQLAYVGCDTNNLETLNIRNGANNFIGIYGFSARGNPNLTCIQVDDEVYSDTTWSSIDATSSFSENCNYPNANLNENNISFSMVPNPASGLVTIETEVEINSVEIFSTSGQQVASFDTKAFDISALQSGVYFVKVLSDNGSFATRIIRE